MMMDELIGLYLLGLVIAALATAYLLPVMIAWLRHAPDIGAVAVVNIVLGWTLIGWVAALALALRRPASPVVQVFSQLNAPPVNGHCQGTPYPGHSLAPVTKPGNPWEPPDA
jgi:hypothetical protein